MKLNDKLYDVLKWIALILLPALAILLSTLLPAYNVDPNTVKVIVLTINSIAAFIGAIIGVSAVTIAQETAQEEFYETDTEEDLELDLPNGEETAHGGEEA